MNTAVAKIRSHFANWRHWELNPIVVKELRQAVRSWAVVGMLLLFLVILFCTSLALLIGQGLEASANQRLGGQIFQIFTTILTVASLAFIPLYVGVRLAIERNESNVDLLYITTLTPQRIIRGKFLCGAYVAVLFFSVCTPFMVFTNLLRGVDLPTIFFVLAYLFVAVCAAIQMAIFLACLAIQRALKVLVGLAATVALFIIIGVLTSSLLYMTRSGVGSMLVGGGRFWVVFFTSFSLILAGLFLLYLLSVALISPPSVNRALPLRSYITSIWLLGAALSFYWVFKERNAELILPWTITSLVVLGGAMAVVVSNEDELSLRVQRRIPGRPATRALAFLFYNGAAGGLVWVTLLGGLTLAVTMGCIRFAPSIWLRTGRAGPKDIEISLGAVAFYLLAYGLTALLIHRRVFPRRGPGLAGTLAVALPIAWTVIPTLILFFLNHLSVRSARYQLGNVFNAFRGGHDQKVAHLLCAGLWALLVLILNAKWFVRQVKRFRPFDASTTAADPAPVPPPIPGQTGALKG